MKRISREEDKYQGKENQQEQNNYYNPEQVVHLAVP